MKLEKIKVFIALHFLNLYSEIVQWSIITY